MKAAGFDGGKRDQAGTGISGYVEADPGGGRVDPALWVRIRTVGGESDSTNDGVLEEMKRDYMMTQEGKAANLGAKNEGDEEFLA
ncbi:hypothetical protein KSP39_PZI003288 [Platanthera zijinensis]|uniref:Uncharacterized protein n=1 Tax=Platanthera zijinensis TaxID=2320716 RepID=A0AAP0BV42_9ASPA